jgi:serine/threonine protein kinase
MVGQSLRVLKNYDIAHLDIKMENILIYKDYFVKLIDFGESYN